jgi:TonB-linked SusC/RagA family outer membrane protein
MKKNLPNIIPLSKSEIKKLLLTMKLALIIVFLSVLQVSANVYSQITVNLDVHDKSIRDVLKTIEQQSQVRFFYSDELLVMDEMIDIKADNKNIISVLDDIFTKSPLTYKAYDNNLIVIAPRELLQQHKITGTVVDKNGAPIPGVNIVVTGTTLGTMSDIAGKYSIDIPEGATSLTFSFIGMNPQEITIGTLTQINVTMTESAIGLDEVIVVGYGTVKKSDLTGSVASIPESRLKELPVTNVLQAVQGAVSGINIVQTTMVPGGVAYNGATTSVIIRGVNSISASSNPLYVVDGVPLMSGSMNDINPNDIKSIEVLKDVSSVAIYGTRGSNGVILITTKHGTDGKPVIKYGVYAGPEKMVNIFEPMNGQEYVRKYVTARLQNGFAVTDSVPTASEKSNYLTGKTTDWVKEISQTGFIQDHNLSLSGGTKGLKYFVSGDYLNQKGVLKGYQYTRVSLRANIDADVTDWLAVGTSLFFVNNNSDGGRVNLLLATQMSPYGQEYDAMGNYFLIPMTNQTLYPNPLLGLNTSATRQNKNMNANFYAELKPSFIKGLKYKLNGGYAFNPTYNSSYTGRMANSLIGVASISNTQNTNWILENILSYDKTLGKHQINLTGLYSAQENKTLNNALNSNTFINDQLDVYNMASGAVQTVSSGFSRNALISQMGRINYSYSGKYLLTLTARRDGYSAFGSGTSKFALFPSVALGWNIAKENFMKQLPIINVLKLRVSYGKSGNQAINPYQTLSTQNTVQYVYNGATATGVIANQLGNTNLTWETSKGINLGLDIIVLKERINATVEYYQMQTSDILLRRNLPNISGFANILDNIGKTQNNGIEVSLKTVNLQIKDFSWETSLNFTVNRNKITELYGDNKDDIGNRWFIGKPLQAVYDYDLIGIWQAGDADLMATMDPGAKVGDMRFRDTNGDNLINEKDRIYLGTSLPKWIGGISNAFSYKNFRLNIFIQTVQGVLKNNAVLNFADQSLIINLPASVDYWTAENQSNTRPSLRTGTNSRGYGYPSDASYTRIKDVTLSYTLPKLISDKLKIGELAIYISGRNLYTFTKWKGWDPENTFTPGYTNNFDNYPNVATYVFGINLTLR